MTVTVAGVTVPRVFVRIAMLWAFLLPLTGLRAPGGVGTIADLVLFGSAPLMLLWVAYRPELKHHIYLVLVITAWLTAVVTITASFFAVDPTQSRVNVIKFGAGLVLVYCLLLLVQHHPGGTRQVACSYVAGSSVLAASTWIIPADANGRAVGLAGHPVEVGGLLALAVCFAAFLKPADPFWSFARWMALALLVSAFGSSLSLTGVVAALLGIGYALGRSGRLTLKGAVVAATAAVILRWLATSLPAGVYLVNKLNLSLSGQEGVTPGDNTLDSRWTTIEFGWHRITDHWLFGNGLDTAGQTAIGFLGPHDILVMAWQTGGILVLAAVVFLLVQSLRAIAVPGLAADGQMVSAIRAGVVASWAAALTGPELYRRAWMLPVFMAIIAATERRRLRQTYTSQVPTARMPKMSATGSKLMTASSKG